MRSQSWNYLCMFFGVAIVIVSVTMDVTGGSDWWHLGTGAGTGLFVAGFMNGLRARRGSGRQRD